MDSGVDSGATGTGVSGAVPQKERLLNFELLRIVSMLLIVSFHFSDWGGILNNCTGANKYFGCLLSIGGTFGVNLFILISGYFMINSRFRTKKLLKIVFQILFYSVVLTSICTYIGFITPDRSFILKTIFPVSYNMYWFATTYVGLYILSPFINKFAGCLTQREFQAFLVVGGLLFMQIPFMHSFLWPSVVFMSRLLWFIYVYLIAAYLRLYGIRLLENKSFCLWGSIALYAGLFAFSAAAVFLSPYHDVFSKLVTYFNVMNSIPLFALSVLFFMYFKHIRVTGGNLTRRLILFFAGTSFGVYLIHINNPFRRYLFRHIIHIQDFYDADVAVLIFYVAVCTIAIYVACSLIDAVRVKLIEEPLFNINIFDKYFKKIDAFMETRHS